MLEMIQLPIESDNFEIKVFDLESDSTEEPDSSYEPNDHMTNRSDELELQYGD